MNFRTDTTLAGYARTAVGLKTRMDAYCNSSGGKHYMTAFAQAFNDNATPDDPATPQLIDVVHRLAGSAWRVGEPYVLAPAMTAIVAAAADALDLTGETLHEQVAPSDFGVLFLPDPIYARKAQGQLTGIAAITWARLSSAHRRQETTSRPATPPGRERRVRLDGARLMSVRQGASILSSESPARRDQPLHDLQRFTLARLDCTPPRCR